MVEYRWSFANDARCVDASRASCAWPLKIVGAAMLVTRTVLIKHRILREVGRRLLSAMRAALAVAARVGERLIDPSALSIIASRSSAENPSLTSDTSDIHEITLVETVPSR